MKVRRGRTEDLDAIKSLSKEFYEKTSYYAAGVKASPTTIHGLLSVLMGDSGIICVAEDDDGTIVGFIAVAILPFIFNSKHLSATELAFYVTPAAQKAGVGKALLTKAEQVARQRGVKFLTMVSLESVNPVGAQALYTQLGYQKNEVAFTKDF